MKIEGLPEGDNVKNGILLELYSKGCDAISRDFDLIKDDEHRASPRRTIFKFTIFISFFIHFLEK